MTVTEEFMKSFFNVRGRDQRIKILGIEIFRVTLIQKDLVCLLFLQKKKEKSGFLKTVSKKN